MISQVFEGFLKITRCYFKFSLNGQSLDNLQLSAGQSVEIEFSVGIPAESASQVSFKSYIFCMCKNVMRIAKNKFLIIVILT